MRASKGLLFSFIVGALLCVAPPAFATCTLTGELFYMHKNDETQHMLSTDRYGCNLDFASAGKITFESAEIVDPPKNGDLFKTAQLEFRYIPKRKYQGDDAFTLKVCGSTPHGSGCSTLHYKTTVAYEEGQPRHRHHHRHRHNDA